MWLSINSDSAIQNFNLLFHVVVRKSVIRWQNSTKIVCLKNKILNDHLNKILLLHILSFRFSYLENAELPLTKYQVDNPLCPLISPIHLLPASSHI